MCVDSLFTLIERFSSVCYTLLDNLLSSDWASVVVLDNHVPNVRFVASLSFSDWVAFVRNHSLI